MRDPIKIVDEIHEIQSLLMVVKMALHDIEDPGEMSLEINGLHQLLSEQIRRLEAVTRAVHPNPVAP